MAADTKADDWFIAAHVLRVRTSSGTASISFKIGSRVANIAALLGCSGPISWKRCFGHGLPIRSATYAQHQRSMVIGRTSRATEVTSRKTCHFFLMRCRARAFNESGSVFFNFEIPNPSSMTFTIKGPVDGKDGPQSWHDVCNLVRSSRLDMKVSRTGHRLLPLGTRLRLSGSSSLIYPTAQA